MDYSKANYIYNLIETQADTFIYPDDVSIATVTAGAPAGTFSAWAEITDGAVTFSSKIIRDTHIEQVKPEDVSDKNQTYLIELSYGAAKIIIARRRFSPLKDIGVIGVEQSCPLIPAGETVYARMMCTNAGETADIMIRYHYH